MFLLKVVKVLNHIFIEDLNADDAWRFNEDDIDARMHAGCHFANKDLLVMATKNKKCKENALCKRAQVTKLAGPTFVMGQS